MSDVYVCFMSDNYESLLDLAVGFDRDIDKFQVDINEDEVYEILYAHNRAGRTGFIGLHCKVMAIFKYAEDATDYCKSWKKSLFFAVDPLREPDVWKDVTRLIQS